MAAASASGLAARSASAAISIPGRADAALGRAVHEERGLQVAQLAGRCLGATREPLDRPNRRALGLRRGHEAGFDLPAIEPDRARAAVPRLAADLRPDQPEVVAQHVGQAPHRVDPHGHRSPVDRQPDVDGVRHASTRSRARRTTVRAASRRYAADAADVVDRRQADEVLRPHQAGGRRAMPGARRAPPRAPAGAARPPSTRRRPPAPARSGRRRRSRRRPRPSRSRSRGRPATRASRTPIGRSRPRAAPARTARSPARRPLAPFADCRSRTRRSARAAAPRADASSTTASRASRLGMPSAAGEALQTLPAIVARAWIWSPPIASAAARSPSKSGGRSASTMSVQVVSAPIRQPPSTASTPRSRSMRGDVQHVLDRRTPDARRVVVGRAGDDDPRRTAGAAAGECPERVVEPGRSQEGHPRTVATRRRAAGRARRGPRSTPDPSRAG